MSLAHVDPRALRKPEPWCSHCCSTGTRTFALSSSPNLTETAEAATRRTWCVAANATMVVQTGGPHARLPLDRPHACRRYASMSAPQYQRFCRSFPTDCGRWSPPTIEARASLSGRSLSVVDAAPAATIRAGSLAADPLPPHGNRADCAASVRCAPVRSSPTPAALPITRATTADVATPPSTPSDRRRRAHLPGVTLSMLPRAG